MANKATQTYWDESYQGVAPYAVPKQHMIRQWIEQHVAPTRQGTCIEVGCYPGRYLAILGELGYELHGLDLTPRVTELAAWFEKMGYKTGAFSQEDFVAYQSDRRYDVVLSLGFIEHFTNWEAVLDKHLDLVAEGGLLVLQAPNFLGSFQNRLHRVFDAENLERHHIPAMDPYRWAAIVEARGFTVHYQGYFGPFHYWIEPQERPLWQRGCLQMMRLAKPVLRRALPRGRKSYAPFSGLIAKRG